MAISQEANVRLRVRHKRLNPPELCPPKSPPAVSWVCPIILLKSAMAGSNCWSCPPWPMKSWHPPPKLLSVWKFVSQCVWLSILIYLLFFGWKLKSFSYFNFLKLFKVFVLLEFFELMASISIGLFYIAQWRTMIHSERYSRRPLLSSINIILGSISWDRK